MLMIKQARSTRKVEEDMRKIFLLKGAPGSGKSTLIREHGWNDMVVSLDSLRAQFSPIIDGGLGDYDQHTIRNRDERTIVEFLHSIIRHRVDLGATVIVDNTNINVRSQKQIAEIGDTRGYETVVVDVQGNTSLDELKRRNQSRESWKIVPEHVVEKMYDNKHKTKNYANLREITPEEMAKEMFVSRTIVPDQERVVVVGDVQSCGNALEMVLNKYNDGNTTFVFTGDLFDRGPDAYKVFSLVNGLGKRAVKVMGNHDEHLFRVLSNPESERQRQTRQSVEQLHNAGVKDSSILKWVKSFVPFFDFTYHGNRYLVTHGGVETNGLEYYVSEDGSGDLEAGALADVSFIQGARHAENIRAGIGDYDENIDRLLSEGSTNTRWRAQFHGHRHTKGARPDQFPGVFSLESEVESGGVLTVAVLDGDNPVTIDTFTEY